MSDISWQSSSSDYFPKATDHIPDMISMIDKLIKNKMAYVGETRAFILIFHLSEIMENWQI